MARLGPSKATDRGICREELGDAPAVVAGSASQAQTQQQELQAPDGIPGDFFGETVSLTADGHTALVGAPFRRVGAAYVFAEQGGKWTLEQELQSPAGSATDTYGYSVALSGDGSTALVGAYSGGSTENGVVYSYALQGGRYVLNGQITAPDGAPGDEFGACVSLAGLGNVALIGAPTTATRVPHTPSFTAPTLGACSVSSSIRVSPAPRTVSRCRRPRTGSPAWSAHHWGTMYREPRTSSRS